MSRRLVREHRLDAYNAWLLVAFGEDGWRALRRKVPTLAKEPPEAAGLTQLAIYHPADGSEGAAYLVVWFDPRAHRSESAWVSTCAHEAHHVAGLVMELIGHEGFGIDEPAAYLAGFVAQFCYESRPEG